MMPAPGRLATLVSRALQTDRRRDERRVGEGDLDHMHRMRNLIAKVGVTLACALTFGTQAPAELIRPKAVRAYPDIAADINGVQTYTYNPATQTGTFQVTNTPYLLALSPLDSGESQIQPNSDGTRRQVVNLTLDRNGHLVDHPENTYALYGTVVLGGETFSGLLLQGKPTAFGATAPGKEDASHSGAGSGSAAPASKDVFELSMKITGGALASHFGRDLYMRIVPRADTFNGQFTRDFSGSSARSNTRGYRASRNVPEPSTIVIVLVCGGGLLLWSRRRQKFAAARLKGPGKPEAPASEFDWD
jgi:hypothetical protein